MMLCCALTCHLLKRRWCLIELILVVIPRSWKGEGRVQCLDERWGKSCSFVAMTSTQICPRKQWGKNWEVLHGGSSLRVLDVNFSHLLSSFLSHCWVIIYKFVINNVHKIGIFENMLTIAVNHRAPLGVRFFELNCLAVLVVTPSPRFSFILCKIAQRELHFQKLAKDFLVNIPLYRGTI